jgi:uncharacterized lipoprotein YddW (UPF0748 family)
VVSCQDSGPTTPGGDSPVLFSLSPPSASPAASPIAATLDGENLLGSVLSSSGPLLLDLTRQTEEEIHFRLGFRGAPDGTYWIRVGTPAGSDSVPFTVEPLGPAEVLREVRALWVSRFEYESPQDVEIILERAASTGFNLVYFQVRGRADAFYQSALEPWSARLTGTLGADPSWDPLELAVDGAQRRGLEIHAWINAFTGWAGAEPPPESTPRHVFLEHPDWVMVDENRVPMPYHSGSRWMTPGHPGVRSRLAAVAADIARAYDVDGIHLDFIRYPDPTYSYDSASLAAFDSIQVLEPFLDFTEMRRRFVTWSVEETRDSLRVVAPDAELSAAVWGVYRNERGWAGVSTGFDTVLQDARAWDRLGLVDALAPMVYWTVSPVYGGRLDFAYLADEHALALEVPSYIGIYVPSLDGAGLARHIERARLAGAEGVSLFSFTTLEERALWGGLSAGAFYWPAVVPTAPLPSPPRDPGRVR